ncbi:MAG: hypothetical protein AAF614_03465 [Chloroflexota bacterium]
MQRSVFLIKRHANGRNAGEFASGSYVTTDAAGNVYVSDAANGRIQKFDSSGTFISEWGTEGASEGQLDDPRGLLVVNNRLYVAEDDNDRIQIFDLDGTFIEMWGWGVNTGANNFEICTAATVPCQAGIDADGAGQFDEPADLAIGSNNILYIAEDENTRIQLFDLNGNFIEMWGWGVDTGANSFEICTAATVPCQEGIQGSDAAQFDDLFGIAIDSNDNVYVTDDDHERIQKFDSNGNFIEMWGWGVDTGANTFEICTAATVPCQASIPGTEIGKFESTEGIAIDANDNVYVADGESQRIQIFDSNGNFLAVFGQAGTETGLLDDPEGITIDADGNIYVLDEDLDKVLQYRLLPVSFTLNDGDSESFGPLAPGSYTIDETNLPTGWTLDSIDCGNASVVATPSGVTIDVGLGENITCTFNNVSGSAKLKVNVDVDPSEVYEPGDDVEFSIEMRNTGMQSLTVTQIVDTAFGDLSNRCGLPIVIPAGQRETCRFTEFIGGNGGTVFDNQVTVTAVDGSGNTLIDTSDEDVHILDIPSSIKVKKDADQSEVLEPGEDVEFTVTVENTSEVDEVTIESVVDDLFGNLNSSCLSGGAVTLAVGEKLTCTFTEFVGGAAGDTHINTVTVSGTDDDGFAVSDDDSEQVAIDNVASSIKVTKTAVPDEVSEPGADVDFIINVVNTSAADDVTINSVIDSVFGNVTSECLPTGSVSLTPGETHSCTLTRFIGGNAGDIHHNEITVSGTDDDGFAVSDVDDEEVRILNVVPIITVTQTTATTVLEPGGTVEKTITIKNDGTADVVTLNSIEDSEAGSLASDCSASFPHDLQPGESLTCQLSTYVEGNAGDVFESRITASGIDDDGVTVEEKLDTSVTLQDVPSSLTVDVNASPQQVTAPGSTVTLGIMIENSSSVDAVTIESVDASNGCAQAMPVTLQPNETLFCEHAAYVNGAAGSTVDQPVVVVGTDDDGQSVEDETSSAIAVLDAAVTLDVELLASTDEVVAPGDDVTFTLTLTNGSETETAVVDSVSHNAFGDLSTSCANLLLLEVAPGQSVSCNFTRFVGGDAGDVFNHIVTIVGDQGANGVIGSDGNATISVVGETSVKIYLPIVTR